MAIKKGAGGLEDLTMGMSTVEQLRNGMPVRITQINAGNIPYSATQSITQKMDNFQGGYDGVYVELDKHIANYDNPHQITPEDVGAADRVHTHTMEQVDGLEGALLGKADVIHTHVISDVVGLQNDLDAKADDGDSFLKTEHLVEGGQLEDAGKPIVLDSTGKLHPTIAGSGLYPVAMYTPDATNEYPDPTGHTFGAYWGIIGIDPAVGYLFVGGDLAGQTVYPNDSIIYGSDGWGLFIAPTGSQDFYRVDGTVALTAPLAGGTQKLSNIGVGTVAGDAVEYSQILGMVKETSRTGSVLTSTGTTAERDTTPLAGYFRFNTELETFEGYDGVAWGSVGGGASGGGADRVFYENDITITKSYEVTKNMNAHSAGPIVLNDNITITIPDGSVWVIS